MLIFKKCPSRHRCFHLTVYFYFPQFLDMVVDRPRSVSGTHVKKLYYNMTTKLQLHYNSYTAKTY